MMTHKAWGFVVWCLMFAGIMIVTMIAQRRSKKVDRNVQSVANAALPEIGEVVQRHHIRKFGEPASAITNSKAFTKVEK